MIRFDGQRGVQAEDSRLSEALRHRGRKQTNVMDAGVLLAFDGLLEEDPFLNMYVTADIIRYLPTSETISAGYSQLGISFFNTLHADFALASWHSSTNILTMARDSLGVKPLYYVHQPGRFVAFSSEIKGLLALPEIANAPNEHKFREYLTWPSDYVPYSVETFYKNIVSVLPGHLIRVSSNRVETIDYWQPNLTQFTGLTTPASFAETFRHTFQTAIARRIQPYASVGAHLSGGLDSSSVCCIAQTQLVQQQRPSLFTFNIDTELPSADEQAYVQAVREVYSVNHHRVQPLTNILDCVLTVQHQFDRPEQFIIPSSFHLSVARRAQQLGCGIILTGHDGDSVAVNGFGFMDQLLEAADWESLLQACSQFISVPGRNLTAIDANWTQLAPPKKLEKYVIHLLGAKLKHQLNQQSIRQFSRSLLQQKQALGFSVSSLLHEVTKRIWHRLTHRRFIDNAFSTSFNERWARSQPLTTAALADKILNGSGVSIKHLISTTNVICNEQLDHLGAYAGHQYSFPFFDKNVVDLGLATPLSIHFDQGRGRGLIRQGLQGIVPPQILTRYTKANFLEYSNLTAQQLYLATTDVLMEKQHPIWDVIDRSAFQSIVDVVFAADIPMKNKVRHNWLLSRIIYLALWLKI